MFWRITKRNTPNQVAGVLGITRATLYSKMRQFDLEMFKAMNEAGGSNPSYSWVEAAVRLMRPIVAMIVLGTWAVLELNGSASNTVTNFASAIGFYLFGDRTLFYSRKAK